MAVALAVLGVLVGVAATFFALDTTSRNNKNAQDYEDACLSGSLRDPDDELTRLVCLGTEGEPIKVEVTVAIVGLAVALLGVGVFVADWVKRDPAGVAGGSQLA